jgi:hypothetical protein
MARPRPAATSVGPRGSGVGSGARPGGPPADAGEVEGRAGPVGVPGPLALGPGVGLGRAVPDEREGGPAVRGAVAGPADDDPEGPVLRGHTPPPGAVAVAVAGRRGRLGVGRGCRVRIGGGSGVGPGDRVLLHRRVGVVRAVVGGGLGRAAAAHGAVGREAERHHGLGDRPGPVAPGDLAGRRVGEGAAVGRLGPAQDLPLLDPAAGRVGPVAPPGGEQRLGRQPGAVGVGRGPVVVVEAAVGVLELREPAGRPGDGGVDLRRPVGEGEQGLDRDGGGVDVAAPRAGVGRPVRVGGPEAPGRALHPEEPGDRLGGGRRRRCGPGP